MSVNNSALVSKLGGFGYNFSQVTKIANFIQQNPTFEKPTLFYAQKVLSRNRNPNPVNVPSASIPAFFTSLHSAVKLAQEGKANASQLAKVNKLPRYQVTQGGNSQVQTVRVQNPQQRPAQKQRSRSQSQGGSQRQPRRQTAQSVDRQPRNARSVTPVSTQVRGRPMSNAQIVREHNIQLAQKNQHKAIPPQKDDGLSGTQKFFWDYRRALQALTPTAWAIVTSPQEKGEVTMEPVNVDNQPVKEIVLSFKYHTIIDLTRADHHTAGGVATMARQYFKQNFPDIDLIDPPESAKVDSVLLTLQAANPTFDCVRNEDGSIVMNPKGATAAPPKSVSFTTKEPQNLTASLTLEDFDTTPYEV